MTEINMLICFRMARWPKLHSWSEHENGSGTSLEAAIFWDERIFRSGDFTPTRRFHSHTSMGKDRRDDGPINLWETNWRDDGHTVIGKQLEKRTAQTSLGKPLEEMKAEWTWDQQDRHKNSPKKTRVHVPGCIKVHEIEKVTHLRRICTSTAFLECDSRFSDCLLQCFSSFSWTKQRGHDQWKTHSRSAAIDQKSRTTTRITTDRLFQEVIS